MLKRSTVPGCLQPQVTSYHLQKRGRGQVSMCPSSFRWTFPPCARGTGSTSGSLEKCQKMRGCMSDCGAAFFHTSIKRLHLLCQDKEWRRASLRLDFITLLVMLQSCVHPVCRTRVGGGYPCDQSSPPPWRACSSPGATRYPCQPSGGPWPSAGGMSAGESWAECEAQWLREGCLGVRQVACRNSQPGRFAVVISRGLLERSDIVPCCSAQPGQNSGQPAVGAMQQAAPSTPQPSTMSPLPLHCPAVSCSSF